MPQFERNTSIRWHKEVPGARWFRSDLHIHTLDDHPASNFHLPDGINGPPQDALTQKAYARTFLQGAIAAGIEVLGLTPHSVLSGDADQTSATFRIVETWNNDIDDDGIPFREKIYAIFPGFEPNLPDGSEGLHLLFLFDPEIGREAYVRVFNTVMGALPPWDGSSLRISPNNAITAFEALEEMHKRTESNWDYLILAPHAFSNRGLFSLKSQILQWFPHQYISAIELKDDWLPEDAYADKPWLKEGMKKFYHAFFHASDAYKVSDIGNRSTFVKLASPHIEALRQAFLASDSRLRIAYSKNDRGELVLSSDIPEPCPASRPWLKAVSIKGGTSFFGGQDPLTGNPVEQTFLLNPDLNCIIGGRMSGKSTFLDGIRVWFGHDLPKDDKVKQDVLDRASKRFLSGDPEISVEIHGPNNPTFPFKDRWPALFYTQRELQKAAEDQETRRQILYRLLPGETIGLIDRDKQIRQFDKAMIDILEDIETGRTIFEEAEQAFQQVRASKIALRRFEEAGINKLTEAQAEHGIIMVREEALTKIEPYILALESESEQLSMGVIINEELNNALNENSAQTPYQSIIREYNDALNQLKDITLRIQSRLNFAKGASELYITNVRAAVQEAIIRAGGNAEDLNQFDTLTASAANYEQAQTQYNRSKTDYSRLFRKFARLHLERHNLVKQQRDAMERVAEAVMGIFPDYIRLQIGYDGISNSLEQWVYNLNQRGVTRWWNDQKVMPTISIRPESIRRSFNKNDLSTLGMSQAVANTFCGLMTPENKLRLMALRNEDKYYIQLKVGTDPNDYKDIDELSGGAQVSVLLSLALETDDPTPLLIDQPEDEIDKAYLFEVLLPALRRLKGRRQVILATHDANIVVNGDGDNVLFLKAVHDTGKISEQGAIEEMGVKEAILNTLDGGRTAFELRQAKYGF